MNTSACSTSATSPTAMVQPPTIVSTVVQNAITGPVTGAAKPNDRIVIAVMIAMITPASAVIEPSTIVRPVAMSAADFSRLPSGSCRHCSALNRLAPPDSIMPSPLTTPIIGPRGSISPSASAPKPGQWMRPTEPNRLRPVWRSAQPILSVADMREKPSPVSPSMSSICAWRRSAASASACARASAFGGSTPVSHDGRPSATAAVASTRSRSGAAGAWAMAAMSPPAAPASVLPALSPALVSADGPLAAPPAAAAASPGIGVRIGCCAGSVGRRGRIRRAIGSAGRGACGIGRWRRRRRGFDVAAIGRQALHQFVSARLGRFRFRGLGFAFSRHQRVGLDALFVIFQRLRP